jgi:hypothetical protein
MKLITITGSRDSLDDLFAQLRQDFEHGQVPVINAGEKRVYLLDEGTANLRIEFLEVSETAHTLEFEERS